MSNPYQAKIETIIEEMMKTFKTQSFNHLPTRLRRERYVEVQTAIISGVLQSMLQFLNRIGASSDEIKESLDIIFKSTQIYFGSNQ